MRRHTLALALALALLLPLVANARAPPPSQTLVIVGGSEAHLQPSAETLTAESDTLALPALPVSIQAAAGLPAVLTRLAPPQPLSIEDAERVAQLAASSPSRDVAGAAGAAASAPPRAAVLLHLLGVPPEHAEALAERVAATLTELGAGVVRHLRVRDDQGGASAASALVRAGADLAAANSNKNAASFRVLESPGAVERCGMECLAHRLAAQAAGAGESAAAFAEEAADALRHAFGLAVPGVAEDEQPVEEQERAAVRRASVPAELLAGELASVLEAVERELTAEAEKEEDGSSTRPRVRVYEATISGLQAMRRADDLAVAEELRKGGGAASGVPGAADDADARVQAASDAFLATLDAVHRAVASRHGGADGVVVQVSLLGDAPVDASAAVVAQPAAAAPDADKGGKGSLTPAVLGGAEAAAMRAPYLAWKRQARRALLQAAGALGEGEEEWEGGHGGGAATTTTTTTTTTNQATTTKRPFAIAATYWGVAIVLVWCCLGGVYCLARMPLAEDTLLFGARKKSD
jgi:hypothetical protein